MKKVIFTIVASLIIIGSVLAYTSPIDPFILKNDIIELDNDVIENIHNIYEKTDGRYVIYLLIESNKHDDVRINDILKFVKSRFFKERCGIVLSYVKDNTLKIKISEHCEKQKQMILEKIDEGNINTLIKNAKENAEYNQLLRYVINAVDRFISEIYGSKLRQELRKLKNKEGKQVFDSDKYLDLFIFSGGTLEYAKRLLTLKTTLGKTIFSGDCIANFKVAGGNFEYAERLSKLTQFGGVTMFKCSQIVWFKKVHKINAEEIEGLAKLEYKPGFPLMDGKHVFDFIVCGGTLELGKRIRTLKDSYGYPTFMYESMAEFPCRSITFEFAEQLLSLKDHKNRDIFDGSSINKFARYRGSFEYARELSRYRNHKGETIFYGDYIAEFKGVGGTLDYARELLRLKNHKGEYQFDAYSIVEFKEEGGTVDYASVLSSVKDKNGESMYDGYYAFMFQYLGVSLEEIQRVLEEKEDVIFKETDKPNAILFYAKYDYNWAIHSTDEIFAKIRPVYDIKVFVISTEDELYEGIASTEDIELLIIHGHGFQKHIVLGRGGQKQRRGKQIFAIPSDKFKIDTTDLELGGYLNKLNPKAVILLNSCSTGEGGKKADNLANFIWRLANKDFISKLFNKRKVYSALKKSYGVEVIKAKPFKAKLKYKDGEDITYVPKNLW